jgi:hypothetical protein
MLHGICSFSPFYYALCTSVSKVRTFAIASKSIFKSHHQKSSWFACACGGVRDRAWQMKKILERNNVAQEGSGIFFQQSGDNGRRKVEIERRGIFSKTNFGGNICTSTPSPPKPRKPPITPPSEPTLNCGP